MYLLIDNYDSFTYNLYALCVKCGMKVKVIKNDVFIDADNFTGIIISPGPSSPDNSGYSLKYLEKYSGKIPFFGVCLGMQCIGHFLGYEVSRAKSVKHGKLDKIKVLKNSIILRNLQTFKAVRYHSLSVKVSLKSEIVKAKSESDDEVMAIENVNKMLFGVQFHPESYLSEEGNKIIKNFKNFCEGRLNNEKRENYKKDF